MAKKEKQPVSGGMTPWLVATSIICGAMVMTIEVLGSRVIGPLFGASLFVWTSLIAVTLLALALGYALGGRLADRSDGSADLLYGLIAIAGGATVLLPTLRAPVLKACIPFGIRLGAFASALCLFGPALLLLGMVSPFLVRIAARELRNVGWTVGLLSSVSTGGSLAGTIAAGFFLIPRFGVTRIFTVCGLILLGVSAAWFVAVRWRYAVLLVLPALLLVGREEPLVSKVQANGTRAEMLERRQSPYGEIKVIEYSYGPRRNREMTIDGLVQGGIDPDSGMSTYEYSYFLSRLARAKNPGGRRALVIGLGAGVVPAWFERNGVSCDVIDIDEEIVEVARDRFGFRSSGRVWVEDARAGISQLPETWDYVVLDVFGGDATPAHLLSCEAVGIIEERVAPGGVLAVNLICQLSPDRWLLASIVKTLREEFDVVEVHPNFDPSSAGPGFGNVTLIAYDGPKRETVRAALLSEPVHDLARGAVVANLGREWAFEVGADAIVLTDDFNPIDFHERAARERLRGAILGTTDFDLLL